ncbi:MAG: LuxR C-terminal-related transcriptional regulator [Kangiellaceae bacterium]|nr:LuxR C-terminal-related transcriptional regulator [Kangiellaceae bacterium]MCW8999033.1 LuxR C-terminal-related transcriptional regulator [Kangiellaceae bacterium]MCW9016574.1 LuxR C-terminal-related transcriptional regulator [Kangiellaceae bacterium]
MQQQPTAFTVDDDEQMRNAIIRTLRNADIPVEGFASAKEFLGSGKFTHQGCLLLDQNMPEMDGLQLQEILLEKDNGIPIIFISGCAQISASIQALKNGAFDFIEKPFDNEQLVRVVKSAFELDLKNRLTQMQQSLTQQKFDSLSKREEEVMHWVVEGKSNKEIARILDISYRTVEIHRTNVMKKMEVDSIASLVKLCLTKQ